MDAGGRQRREQADEERVLCGPDIDEERRKEALMGRRFFRLFLLAEEKKGARRAGGAEISHGGLIDLALT